MQNCCQKRLFSHCPAVASCAIYFSESLPSHCVPASSCPVPSVAFFFLRNVKRKCFPSSTVQYHHHHHHSPPHRVGGGSNEPGKFAFPPTGQRNTSNVIHLEPGRMHTNTNSIYDEVQYSAVRHSVWEFGEIGKEVRFSHFPDPLPIFHFFSNSIAFNFLSMANGEDDEGAGRGTNVLGILLLFVVDLPSSSIYLSLVLSRRNRNVKIDVLFPIPSWAGWGH